MSRATRRACFRALPALLAVPVAVFAPAAAPGVVFFALVGPALSFIDLRLSTRDWRTGRVVVLAISGAALYGFAALQAVYASGVIGGRSLDSGVHDVARFVRDVTEWRRGDPMGLVLTSLVLACAGLAHVGPILANAEPERRWQKPEREVLRVLLGGVILSGLPMAITCLADSRDRRPGLFACSVFVIVGLFLALVSSVLLVLLTSACDSVEAHFWPLERREIEGPA